MILFVLSKLSHSFVSFLSNPALRTQTPTHRQNTGVKTVQMMYSVHGKFEGNGFLYGNGVVVVCLCVCRANNAQSKLSADKVQTNFVIILIVIIIRPIAHTTYVDAVYCY